MMLPLDARATASRGRPLGEGGSLPVPRSVGACPAPVFRLARGGRACCVCSGVPYESHSLFGDAPSSSHASSAGAAGSFGRRRAVAGGVGSLTIRARRGSGFGTAAGRLGSRRTGVLPAGIATSVLHFGQRTRFPAAVAGTARLLPHSAQGITILSDITFLAQQL